MSKIDATYIISKMESHIRETCYRPNREHVDVNYTYRLMQMIDDLREEVQRANGEIVGDGVYDDSDYICHTKDECGVVVCRHNHPHKHRDTCKISYKVGRCNPVCSCSKVGE